MEKAVQFDIITAIDNIDNAMDMFKGMLYMLQTAIEALPQPKKYEDFQHINMFQTSATTLFEAACNTLKAASEGLHNCIRNNEEDAQNV